MSEWIQMNRRNHSKIKLVSSKICFIYSKLEELKMTGPKSMMKRLRNKFYMWNLYNWRSKTELKLNEDIMYKQVLDEAYNDDGVVRKRMDNVIVFPPPQDYLGKVFDCLNYPIPFCSAWVWLSRGWRARSLSTWPSWPALVWCCTRM